MKSNHSICMRKAGKIIFGKVRFSGNWKKVEGKKNGKVLWLSFHRRAAGLLTLSRKSNDNFVPQSQNHVYLSKLKDVLDTIKYLQGSIL